MPTKPSKTITTTVITTTRRISIYNKLAKSSAIENSNIDNNTSKNKNDYHGKIPSSSLSSSPPAGVDSIGIRAGTTGKIITSKQWGQQHQYQHEHIFFHSLRAGDIPMITTSKARNSFSFDRFSSSSSLAKTTIELAAFLLAIEIGTRLTQNLHLAIS